MVFHKLGSAALLALLAVQFTGAAQAAEVYKDSLGKVYVSGVTPSTDVEFVFTGLTQTKSYISDTCGAIYIKGSATSPIPSSVVLPSGTTVNTTTLTVGLKPKCTTGAWDVTPTTNLKTPTNEVIIIGQTPNAAVSVNFTGATVKKTSADTCGIAKIGGTSFTPSGTVIVAGVTSTVASMTTKANPDICKTGVRYVATP
jgi:hypothetical protein